MCYNKFSTSTAGLHQQVKCLYKDIQVYKWSEPKTVCQKMKHFPVKVEVGCFFFRPTKSLGPRVVAVYRGDRHLLF